MIKKLLPIVLLMLLAATANAQTQQVTTLMPMPKSITVVDGKFALTPSFTIAVKTDAADATLYFGVNRALQTLNRRTQLFFKQQRITASDKADSASLLITVRANAGVVIGQDESYSITVSAKQIKLEAPNTTGALHGLETFLQLVQYDDTGYYLPIAKINDSPRFVWRGLMIDVARHFIPLDVIERNIDAMAAVKMNVLHLHLSDDEGFRIESKVFPELQKKGSFGEYFTQSEIKDLIAYAKKRGVMIVPEFDMPGHTTGFLAGYPSLSATPGKTYMPGPRFSPGDKPMGLMDIMKMLSTAPTPTFDPSKESTYLFLNKFLGEMSALFPSPYIHIGADENNGVAWKNNPAIVAFMKDKKIADTHALQAYFVSRVQKILTKHHKHTTGWEELLSKDLPKDVAVQVWQDGTKARSAAGLGHPVIISNGFYLDLFMPAYIHYQNYLFANKLEYALAAKVLGGEAAQWAEAMDKNNAETRMWPRTAAIAERLWSPVEVNDVDDMYRRLAVLSRQLDDIGLQHISEYEKGLRRLNDGGDIIALKTLADVLSPVKGYKKLFAKMTKTPSASYQTAPLATLSDVIMVDSEVKRKFRALVKSYLQSPDHHSYEAINAMLMQWANQYADLQSMPGKAQLNADIMRHAKNMSDAGFVGLEALKKWREKEQPSADWIKQQMAKLQRTKQVYGEAEIAVIPEIEALVNQKLAPEPTSYPMF
ncbi:beta-N-acetylhexosaminidase [Mucilaginibacter psychrotolerans]|uniref:beta-N-acetylhexosaminidase n=1 Tax=Mucilaginibacter psychrotolerans TaxID=1524096 RepID=A0A4Y8S5D9_9SPHI|nr:beta-N-acetylhexosaminidase [Mucilaginibacter psychrotolerans]TFF34199.1 beta-hexosaminidase [Mucilaginibacter psychrotolerans]